MGAWVRVPVFFSTQDALVAGGIITALVIAMRHHTTSEPLAMHATDALTVLASDPTHRQAVVMAGGAEAVTACMAAHADSAEMQAAGCALLQVISFDETVKPDLVEAGCVTAASEALSRHADVRWVAPQLRGVDPSCFTAHTCRTPAACCVRTGARRCDERRELPVLRG